MKKLILTALTALLLFSGYSCTAIEAPGGLDVLCSKGDINDCEAPLLSWDPVGGAVTYTVKYVRTSDDCSVVASTYNDSSAGTTVYVWKFLIETSGTSVAFSSADASTRYCWFVYATDQSNIDSSLGRGPAISTADIVITPPTPHNGGGYADLTLKNPLKANNLKEAFDALFNILFWIAVALTPIMIIYAAFLLTVAHGDPKQIKKAQTIITWAISAFAIVLLAKGIPSLVSGLFGAK